MSLITQADLRKDLSEAELQELTDLNGDGAINETVLADVVEETAGLIASYLPVPANPSLLLKTIAARLVVHELKRRNGILSAQDREDFKDHEARLLKMASGKLLASTPEACPEAIHPSPPAGDPVTTHHSRSAFVHGGGALDLEELA